MKSYRLRLLLFAFLLALCGTGGYILLFAERDDPGPPAVEQGPILRSAGNEPCRECHEEIYAQWKDSYHGQAWTDPHVRSLSVKFSTTRECWPCHAPNPVFLDGLGQPPTHRSFRQVEGVGCVACHFTPEGAAGRKDAPEAACRPVKRLDQKTVVDLCVGCHNQHKTVDEWKTSKYFLDKDAYRDCGDCHMPRRQGEPSAGAGTRAYPAHAWPGGHDLAFLKMAASVRVRIEGRRIFVEVENTGCGHNFPTDSRHRAVELEVDLPNRPWETTPLIYARFRNPYRNDGGENTQIKPGEVIRRQADLPLGKGHVRVRLLYLPKPWNKEVSYKLLDDRRVVLFEENLPYYE